MCIWRPAALLSVKAMLLVMVISACSKPPDKPVTIAINPWPGYEFLFLAQEKGFFQQVGVNIRLYELMSLSDTQRAFMSGRADGFASTIVEVVQAGILSQKGLKVALIPDYSSGGDVIVATKDIQSVADLKGKIVGCEVTSLGIYVLHKALETAGLTLEDIRLVNVEQTHAQEAMAKKTIQAHVTYPPVSISLLKNKNYHVIFSSEEIPYQIVDTIALSDEVIERNPNIVSQLHQVWQMAVSYARENPEDAIKIMSSREKITEADFESALTGMKILNYENQKKIFSEPDKLQDTIRRICDVLVKTESLKTDCLTMPDMVYRGRI